MTFNQVQVSQFFSEFTQYENEDVQEIYTALDDQHKVRQVYSPDSYYPPSEVQKSTYHSSYPSNKNITKEYTKELPIHITSHLIFKNIYFKGNNNTWISQDYDEICEDSSLSSIESLQTTNKKENNANHVEKNISGTNSTKKKNESTILILKMIVLSIKMTLKTIHPKIQMTFRNGVIPTMIVIYLR